MWIYVCICNCDIEAKRTLGGSASVGFIPRYNIGRVVRVRGKEEREKRNPGIFYWPFLLQK